MWQIVKNEWYYLIRSRALLAVSLGFVTVLLLAVFMGHLQTQKQADFYQNAKAHLRTQWEQLDGVNPHSAAHYGTYVFKPVNILGNLDEGVNAVTGNVIQVEGHVQNEMAYSEASQMQAISRFGKLKSALLLQYILPLLLVFLAFHTIHSEQESGRLKLLLLQGQHPWRLLWAKTLSVWCFGVLLLMITIGVYLGLYSFQIEGDVLLRVLLFFLSYSLYYFVLCGLTVYFTVRWKTSALALTTMIGLWMVWTIFSPHMLLSAVEQENPLPTRAAFQAAMKTDRAEGLDGHNPSDQRRKALEEKLLKDYQVDSLSQLPINFSGVLMQEDERYGNKVWDKHFGQLRQVMAQQKQHYQWGGVLNPFIALQNLSRGLAGTDNLHHQDFLLQVEAYRRVFIKALNDKLAFGGSKTGEWNWTADNAFFKSVADFNYKFSPLKTMYTSYVFDVITLLSWTLLIGLLLMKASKKIMEL